MNKYAIAMGTAIAACAASVVLLILKCYGVHIEWAWVLMPVLIVAGVWFVVFLLAWVFRSLQIWRVKHGNRTD